MQVHAGTISELEEICGRVRDGLRDVRLSRTELSDMEAALGTVSNALDHSLEAALHEYGFTPDLVVANLAHQTLRETLEWSRIYRKNGTVSERRERIHDALQSALGAIVRIQRVQGTHLSP
ncbi:MAG: hypothetical protein NVSMB52_19700 [Chloroflexota bacterium]